MILRKKIVHRAPHVRFHQIQRKERCNQRRHPILDAGVACKTLCVQFGPPDHFAYYLVCCLQTISAAQRRRDELCLDHHL